MIDFKERERNTEERQAARRRRHGKMEAETGVREHQEPPEVGRRKRYSLKPPAGMRPCRLFHFGRLPSGTVRGKMFQAIRFVVIVVAVLGDRYKYPPSIWSLRTNFRAGKG